MILLYSFIPYWSLETTILYTLMGLVCVWGISMVIKYPTTKPFYKNKYYQTWFCIWTFIAAFRFIDGGAGGTDAIGYYYYFLKSFDIHGWEMTPLGLYDTNLGFRWYNRILRLVSDNQIFYLAITHGIMLFCVIKFIDFFKFKKVSVIPFFLIVFWYVRGFCTIRSNLASAILLISLIYLAQNKYRQSIITAIVAVLFHKMMILYAMFIPFYWYAQKKKIKLKLVVVFLILISMVATAFTTFVFGGNLMGDEFTDHYGVYSENASEVGFLGNFWKIAFEQIVLGVLMVIFRKSTFEYKRSCCNLFDSVKFDIIWYSCLFDMLLIPICSSFGIWRGYEVFYIPRLVMWSILLHIVCPREVKRKIVFYLIAILCFGGWFWQRTSAESFWKETNLMPYMFNI